MPFLYGYTRRFSYIFLFSVFLNWQARLQNDDFRHLQFKIFDPDRQNPDGVKQRKKKRKKEI